MVGLFDSLRQFTKQLGKLVNTVGDRLDDRRQDVVRIAGEVDTQVQQIYSASYIQSYRQHLNHGRCLILEIIYKSGKEKLLAAFVVAETRKMMTLKNNPPRTILM